MTAATVTIEQVTEPSEELVAAIAHLLPQLSEARTPPTLDELGETIATQTLLVAREDDGRIVGTLTLVTYRVASGQKARIEDVIVDDAARGQGVGEALTREGMRRAAAAGARTVELTSMPYRESAIRLYRRLGFVQKRTNVYVWRPR